MGKGQKINRGDHDYTGHQSSLITKFVNTHRGDVTELLFIFVCKMLLVARLNSQITSPFEQLFEEEFPGLK